MDIKKQLDPTERLHGNMQYQHAIQIFKRRLPRVLLINTISLRHVLLTKKGQLEVYILGL